MNGYNFTERVRKVLAMAREEAARLHHEYVGTEHILLGLIKLGQGVAVNAVHPPITDTGWVTEEVERFVAGDPHFFDVAQPEEVADVIAFLTSAEGGRVTGTTIRMG